MELTREVQVTPAFDRRDPSPSKNYGIHGAELRFLLKGPHGVIQFVIYTNWHLEHVQDELLGKPMRDALGVKGRFCPIPADIGYHAFEPHYEGQESMGSCEYLDGKPCYYDGSGLNAARYYQIMIAEGSEALWKALEAHYKSTFYVEIERDEQQGVTDERAEGTNDPAISAG
jgi:hypothetical protein